MSVADIVVILIAAIPIIIAIRYLIKVHKMGGCAGCSECCDGGGCSGSCHTSKKKQDK